MTTEEDFQRALDARPDDWQCRLLFADWLQEHDDPREEGYRALALLRRVPRGEFRLHLIGPRSTTRGFWWTKWRHVGGTDVEDAVSHGSAACLPWDWRVACGGTYSSCHEAEDAAAHAFARLPAERRAELLATRVGW